MNESSGLAYVILFMLFSPLFYLFIFLGIGVIIYRKVSKRAGIITCSLPFVVFVATYAYPIYTLQRACAIDGGFHSFGSVGPLDSVIYINKTIKHWANGCNYDCAAILAVPGIEFVEATIGQSVAEDKNIAPGLYRFSVAKTELPRSSCFVKTRGMCIVATPVDSFQSSYVLLNGFAISGTFGRSDARDHAGLEWDFDPALVKSIAHLSEGVRNGRYVLLDRSNGSPIAQSAAYWLNRSISEWLFLNFLDSIIPSLITCEYELDRGGGPKLELGEFLREILARREDAASS